MTFCSCQQSRRVVHCPLHMCRAAQWAAGVSESFLQINDQDSTTISKPYRLLSVTGFFKLIHAHSPVARECIAALFELNCPNISSQSEKP